MFGLSIRRAADCREFAGEATVEGQEGSTNKGRSDCGENATCNILRHRPINERINNQCGQRKRVVIHRTFIKRKDPNLSTMER